MRLDAIRVGNHAPDDRNEIDPHCALGRRRRSARLRSIGRASRAGKG